MANLNNPAGRLHQLLSEFAQVHKEQKTVNQTWAEVLGTQSRVSLRMRLGEVAQLIPAIYARIDQLGRPEIEVLYTQFVTQWMYPFAGFDGNTDATPSPSAAKMVNTGALAALGSLSVALDTLAPDGDVPNEIDAEVSRTGLNDLLNDLTTDQELSAELKAAIAARVHDILWAMDHVRITGPEGVQAAVERLVGQLNIFTAGRPEVKDAGIFKRVVSAAGAAWTIYKAGPEAATALEGWQNVLEIGSALGD